MNIGILHPGEMGISIAASAIRSGHSVFWVSQGRSAQTAKRAAQFALLDAHTLENLCHSSEVVISICPPHAAEQVAEDVLARRFRGIYIDANAISPQRAEQIAGRVSAAGVSFVDGGVIGGPAWEAGETCMYLSGERAAAAADIFSAGPLATSVIGPEPGKASALKMCYASYTKGTTALLCAALAAAECLGVRRELEQQWELEDAGSIELAHRRARRVTKKAWRFSGEMEEISATFSACGLPGELHAAAGEIYSRLEQFRSAPALPELEYVLHALLQNES
jgi:3-hydroxyisobutyrate dehydrogenase-like beta-hydroxyacid dehydrogenase